MEIKINLNKILENAANKHLGASIQDILKDAGIDTYEIYTLLEKSKFMTTAAMVGAMIDKHEVSSEAAKLFVKLSLENQEEFSKYWITLPWFISNEEKECYLTSKYGKSKELEKEKLAILIATSGYTLEDLSEFTDYIQSVNEEKQKAFEAKMARLKRLES